MISSQIQSKGVQSLISEKPGFLYANLTTDLTSITFPFFTVQFQTEKIPAI